MIIGIFGNQHNDLVITLQELAQTLQFKLCIFNDYQEFASSVVDGVIVLDDELNDDEISKALKRYINILFLNPGKARELISPEMVCLAEETSVELSVAGPKVSSSVFKFIESNISAPYYVRVVNETCALEPLSFASLYESIYWNAYFTDVEISKMKINVLPAVTVNGVVLYGRTEAGAGIPVDIWSTNLGFHDSHLVKIFSQSKVAEVDCLTGECQLRTKRGEQIKNSGSNADYRSAYIESFVETIQRKTRKSLNIPAWQFLKLVEFFENTERQMNL